MYGGVTIGGLKPCGGGVCGVGLGVYGGDTLGGLGV